MNFNLSRREFVKSSILASAVLPSMVAAADKTGSEPQPGLKEAMPLGTIGNQQFSRLMLGGNLIGGYAHSRDLGYVSTLMRRYNTPAKIRETIEIAESQGINAINTWVMQENQALFDHWKNGGKMKWFSQVRMDPAGGFDQARKAADQGAAGIHLTGDSCEGLLDSGKFEKVAESIQFIRSKKLIAGVAAHDLRVIQECERLKMEPDFYQKTLHTHDYFSAPAPGNTEAISKNDNSWCSDPQAVVNFMAGVKKPWIAFKILAAGALHPRAAFPYAFNAGADFILVGMFDWQVRDDAQLAARVFRIVRGTGSKRARPWFGDQPNVSKA